MNRKPFVILMTMMALVLVTAVVYAANTPGWWNNPGGATSWHTTGQFFGNAANATGSNQILTIQNDVVTCNVGDHIELWMQIAWVNTGTPNVTLRTSNGLDRIVEWTTNASGCPANVTDPLPAPTGFDFLTNELAFVPTGNSVPGGFAFDNGYERSYTFADSTATCARPSTVFDIPDGAGFEYRIEVQSVCVSPTAVTLQTVSANNQSALFPLALGALLLVLFSAGLVYNRKQQAA